MVKRILITVGVVLALVAAGGGAYIWTSAEDAAERPGETPLTSPSVQPSSPPTAKPSASSVAAAPGAYLAYRPGIIEATPGTKILFFHAPWCPQCRKLEQSIRAGMIPPGVTIIKTDYDSNQTLRQKYGVTIQTTLVRVDEAGRLHERYVAYDSPTLDAVLKNALP